MLNHTKFDSVKFTKSNENKLHVFSPSVEIWSLDRLAMHEKRFDGRFFVGIFG